MKIAILTALFTVVFTGSAFAADCVDQPALGPVDVSKIIPGFTVEKIGEGDDATIVVVQQEANGNSRTCTYPATELAQTPQMGLDADGNLVEDADLKLDTLLSSTSTSSEPSSDRIHFIFLVNKMYHSMPMLSYIRSKNPGSFDLNYNGSITQRTPLVTSGIGGQVDYSIDDTWSLFGSMLFSTTRTKDVPHIISVIKARTTEIDVGFNVALDSNTRLKLIANVGFMHTKVFYNYMPSPVPDAVRKISVNTGITQVGASYGIGREDGKFRPVTLAMFFGLQKSPGPIANNSVVRPYVKASLGVNISSLLNKE